MQLGNPNWVKGKSANPAGRPKNLINKLTRPVIRDYFNKREIAELVEKAKEMAKTKPDIMKFLLEQVFGRAPQPIENSSENKFVLAMVRYDDNSPIDVPNLTIQPPKAEAVTEPAVEQTVEQISEASYASSNDTSERDNQTSAQTGSVL